MGVKNSFSKQQIYYLEYNCASSENASAAKITITIFVPTIINSALFLMSHTRDYEPGALPHIRTASDEKLGWAWERG